MKRRDFIRTTSLAGVILPVAVLHACEKPTGQTTDTLSDDKTFELDELTVDALQEAMKQGKYTSHAITQLYLERIQSIDKGGARLNSVIEINPEALSIADMLDDERKNGNLRGLLHGIPVLIKDNIDTGDKMMTTAGSLALEGHHAAGDAFIVQKLRDAGAVLLGKTNLSEWANFRSSRSSSGWSSRGGQTKNPFVLDRNPCGSSSGSGAAVSANLCTIAIGTETNGSIACPSSINGVVGIKPTVGLWSRRGIIPISYTQDTAGPMARTVRDAALLLGALTGADDQDAITKKSDGKALRDYTPFLREDGLQGKRIGVEKSFLKVHEGVDAIFKEAIETLKQKGAEVIEIDFLKRVKGISAEEYNVLQYEFKDGIDKYLANANASVKSLRDVIAFNKKHAERTMPFFQQEILESAQDKGTLDSKEYKDALTRILSVTRSGIDETLKALRLDAIGGPTNGPSWCTDLINGDFFTGYGMYSPAAIAGYPHISVPMGHVQGLPVGLTFIATAWAEPSLITIAYAYEQASRKRVAPEFHNDPYHRRLN